MKRFEPSTPHAAAVVAALAMTLITFGLAIVAPAMLDAAGNGYRVAQANAVLPAASDRVLVAASVDVHRPG